MLIRFLFDKHGQIHNQFWGIFITYPSWIASVSMTSFLEPSMTLARASCLMLLSILVTSSWCGWRGRRAAMGQVLAEWLVVDSRLVLAIDGRRLLNSLRVMTVLPSLPTFTVYTLYFLFSVT